MTMAEKMAIEKEMQRMAKENNMTDSGYKNAMMDVANYILDDIMNRTVEEVLSYVWGHAMYGETYYEGMENDEELAKELLEENAETNVSFETFTRALTVIGKDLTEINGRLDDLEKHFGGRVKA